MAPLHDAERRRCYLNALAKWRYEGYILFTEVALAWLRAHLPEYSAREIGRLLHGHVAAGGEIDEQPETRPEWSMHSFHYDLRPTIAGRVVYFETRLLYDDPDDPDDPYIHVVNVHDA